MYNDSKNETRWCFISIILKLMKCILLKHRDIITIVYFARQYGFFFQFTTVRIATNSKTLSVAGQIDLNFQAKLVRQVVWRTLLLI